MLLASSVWGGTDSGRVGGQAMQRNGSIFVLGSFVADVPLRVPRLPAWGETLLAAAAEVGPGGKGSNQAIAAAKAGGKVTLLTRIGADVFGQLGRRAWQEAGVDTSLVLTGETPTGVATILLNEDSGQNAIAISPGACGAMLPEDVQACAMAIRSAAVFLAQLELPLPVVQAGLRIARDAGVMTVLNPAPVPRGGVPCEIFDLCDVLIPNETECAQLVSRSDGVAANAAALRQRVKRVIVTMGAAGALIAECDQAVVKVPSVTVGGCVDTTGAGDAFCGALAVALAGGRSFEEAVRWGCAAGAVAVTRPGAGRSMPSREEIDAAYLLY